MLIYYIMANMNRDRIVKVDEHDNEIGEIEKIEAHKAPILHRAFSVFIINDKNEMLIQQRAFNKYHSGGLWANACCSHPRVGEEVISSAKERMKDEIGVSCELKELFTFIYETKFSDNLYEHELDHVLLGHHNGPFVMNKEEVNDLKWISYKELAKDLEKHPDKYASWFKIAAPKVLKYLNK